jgi:hypothetical protein
MGARGSLSMLPQSRMARHIAEEFLARIGAPKGTAFAGTGGAPRFPAGFVGSPGP